LEKLTIYADGYGVHIFTTFGAYGLINLNLPCLLWLGSIPSRSRHGIYGAHLSLNTGLCIPCESENHGNVGHISTWDINEPLRVRTCISLAMSTLSANLERSAWHKYSEKVW